LQADLKLNDVNTLSYKTVSTRKEDVQHDWLLVDAEGQTLGRLASKVAKLLRGKHKPCFTPHVDCGDHVVIINAEKIQLTGNKWQKKEYKWHTGYPGGLRSMTAQELWKKHPERLIEKAVKGMLPKNRLGRQMYRKLHVYAGPEHKHQAQEPKTFDINSFK
jgi:large subunit ribosomal protein L13